MALIQNLIDFLQEVFMPASPEVKKRLALRKIETNVKNYTPLLYKNDMLLPNFAEAVRILFVNTKPVFDLLSETICSEDLERNHHFSEQLMLTGFSDEAQQIISNLSYANRKEAAERADSLTRHFEREHIQLEKAVSELKSDQFSKIDEVMGTIKQLNDVCKLNYVTYLKLFDQHFSATPNYMPSFQAIPLELAENALQDIYYVLAGLDISNSTGNAIRALYQLYNRNRINHDDEIAIGNSLRKIQGVIKNVLTTDMLLNLIRLAKGDPLKVPEKGSYASEERVRYAKFLENRFVIDEGRLKNELQNETIKAEVSSLFNGKNNELLKQSTPCSFFWILPMQVLKTFLRTYFEDKVKPFLNDIVIEGFFNLNDYKSDFAAQVYAVNDSLAHIQAFEQKFQHLGPYDETMLVGFIRDSHKDTNFLNKLKSLVDSIDKEAKIILQNEASAVFRLHSKVQEIVVEAKKPTSDLITNVKVLAMSSRNRDNFAFLDTTIQQWQLFLNIMKDYVVLSSGQDNTGRGK